MYRKIPNSSTAEAQEVIENYIECWSRITLTYYNLQWTLALFPDQCELLLSELGCESISPGASLRPCFPGTKVAWCQRDDFAEMAWICHRHIIPGSAVARVKYSSLNQSCLAPLWPLEYIILLSNAQYTSICQHSILSLFDSEIFSIYLLLCTRLLCVYLYRSLNLQTFWDFLVPFLLLLPLYYLCRDNMRLLQRVLRSTP